MGVLFNGKKWSEDKKRKAFYYTCFIVFCCFAINHFDTLLISDAELTSGQFFMLSLFKYTPVVVTSALCGSIPALFSVMIVFWYKTITFSSFAYMTFIYMLVAMITHQNPLENMYCYFVFSDSYRCILVYDTWPHGWQDTD